jgi:ClpP class serine protease
MIVDYPGRVTTRIDGLCASAATYVAMAGDRVVMQDSAFFMIHDPWTIAWGGVDELKKSINLLKSIKDGIIETYQNKTHLETEELSRMMSAETWMTASQALEKGFVDEISDGVPKSEMKIQNMAILNCLRSYEHVPAELLEKDDSEADEKDETKEAENEDATDEENVTGEATTSDAKPDADETDESLGDSNEDAATESTEKLNAQEEAQQLRDYLSIFGPRR